MKILNWAKIKFKWRMGRVLVFLRKIRVPGFGGVPLLDVIIFFFRGLFDQRFPNNAGAMAYNFFLSFFPLLVLLYALLLSIPIETIEAAAFNFVEQFESYIPPEMNAFVIARIEDSAKPFKLSGGFIILNIFLVLYGASRGILAMMRAFSKDPKSAEEQAIFRQRNFFQMNGMSLLILFVLSFLGFLTLVTFVLGQAMLAFLTSFEIITGGLDIFLLHGLVYILTLVLIFFSVTIIYYLAPSTHERWRFFSPGAVVTSFLILLILVGFGQFITYFVNVSRFYGGIASIYLLLIWFYLISIVLLIGFEFNTAIQMAQHKQNKHIRLDKGILSPGT